jgi:hypothetical protein
VRAEAEDLSLEHWANERRVPGATSSCCAEVSSSAVGWCDPDAMLVGWGGIYIVVAKHQRECVTFLAGFWESSQMTHFFAFLIDESFASLK